MSRAEVAVGDVRMPDLCSPQRGVRQTIDSAIPGLLRLGVDADRIVIESAGAGWVTGTVVHQAPAPGSVLTTQTRVVLAVAGTGALESLPFALREEDAEGFMADRLFALFDSPLRKLAFHIREAGGFLKLHPDDFVGSRRWIEEIFQMSVAPWPERLWYPVALLLPALHRLAGRRDGLDLAFRLVFDLPIADIRVRAGVVPLAAGRQTRLGTENGRLGVDAVVGLGVTSAQAAEVTIGPVEVEQYLAHLGDGPRRQREGLYRLVLPCHLFASVMERWIVGDRANGARLGRELPPILGVNCYLGGYRKGAPGDG